MEQKIIERIQKLLAMAEGGTENESKVAMLKAQELMAKHKLSMKDLSIDSSKVTEEATDIEYSKLRWKAGLSLIISENFGCLIFTRRIGSKKTIYFIGKEEDIEIGVATLKYAIRFVEAEVKKLKNIAKKNGRSTRGIEESYGVGFASGLEELFKEQKSKNEEWALVMVVDQEVQDFYDNKDMKKTKPRATKVYEDFFNKGFKEGKEFNIHSGIEGSCHSEDRLIG